MVCVHGFTDTWRTWELVLPALERHHDVLAPTLTGHAGGPPLEREVSDGLLADAVERAMDEAGFDTAHLVGNSLGGYVVLTLAARGRADSVVALAPAGGWPTGDGSFTAAAAHFRTMHELLQTAAPYADRIVATAEGRRRATEFTTSNFEHIPAELLAHQICGAALCDVGPLLELGLRDGWGLDAERITCPVRIIWGTDDKLLEWPSSAARLREDWLPHADWTVLEGVGHCPQLDVPTETAALILEFTDRRGS
jgi:pimeloyl-ACP methyl ester carboxylesterase